MWRFWWTNLQHTYSIFLSRETETLEEMDLKERCELMLVMLQEELDVLEIEAEDPTES